MQSRPNILLILTDQQSAQMLSCSGNPQLRTPAMDSIARKGIRFERAHCMNPMCVPSRYSLFTGHRGSEIGLTNNDNGRLDTIPPEITSGSMGWQLRAAGYETAYGGKVHWPKGLTPEDLGFESISHDDRDQLADDCAEYLSRDHDAPFLLVASFVNPHDICHMAIRDFAETEQEKRLSHPVRVELRELDEALRIPVHLGEAEFFASVCPPLPDNFEAQADEPEAITLMQARSPFKRKAREGYSEEDWRRHRWAYARLTERVDGQIGRVLTALEENDLTESTLTVFTSDHGDMDASHRMEHKTAFYDQAVRIPLLISGPGVVPRGTADPRLVSNGLDLLPTFCELAGLEAPPELEGRSLTPLMSGSAVDEWRRFLPVESELGQMIVHGDFKYMRHYQGANSEQLIDLVSDPGEMRNAIYDERHEPILAEVRDIFDDAFPLASDPFAAERG